LSAEHFHRTPGAITWADVGTFGSYIKLFARSAAPHFRRTNTDRGVRSWPAIRLDTSPAALSESMAGASEGWFRVRSPSVAAHGGVNRASEQGVRARWPFGVSPGTHASSAAAQSFDRLKGDASPCRSVSLYGRLRGWPGSTQSRPSIMPHRPTERSPECRQTTVPYSCSALLFCEIRSAPVRVMAAVWTSVQESHVRLSRSPGGAVPAVQKPQHVRLQRPAFTQ
jgi:hypothetical protein